MSKITVNPNRLYTKTAYSHHAGVTRPTIDKWIEEGKLKILNVNGTTLIVG